MSLQIRLSSFMRSATNMFGQQSLTLENLFKRSVSLSFPRQKSTTSVNEDRIVITDDGSTIVCWHPEKPFPYECSKPIPVNSVVEHSVLKVQNNASIYEVFKTTKEDEVREELMKITHTTKHRWFPNKKLFRRRKYYKDREYL